MHPHDPEPRPAAGPFAWPAAWALLACLLAALMLTWLNGYAFGDSNHTVQVPLVKSWAQGDLYSGDPLLWTRAGYATVVYPLIGRLLADTRLIEPSFFVLFLLTQTATLAAGAALARALFPNLPAAPPVAVFLMMAPLPSLAAERGFVTRFAHTDVAFAVLLWALYCWLRQRPLRAALLVGLAFNLHGSYALHVALLLAGDVLLRPRDWDRRKLLRSALAGLVVALPTLIWALSSAEPMSNEWLRLVRLRSAHHSFPLHFAPETWGRYLAVLALGALSLRHGIENAQQQRLARLLLGLLPLLAAGVLFAECWPVKAVIQAQTFRSTRLLTCVVLLCAARLLVLAWRAGGPERLAVVLLGLGLVLPGYDWLLPAALLLFLLCERARLSARLLAIVLALAGAVRWGGYALPDTLWTRTTASYLEIATDPLFTSWVLVLVLIRAAQAVARRRTQVLLGLGIVSFLVGVSIPAFYARLTRDLHDDAWVRLQLWARANTTPTSSFLTPPYLAGFRVFSERPVVGEWKDGTMQYFSEAFNREWYARMQALGGGDERFDRLSAEELRALAQRYGARYLVVPARRVLPFQRLRRAEGYAVYEPAVEAAPGSSESGAAQAP